MITSGSDIAACATTMKSEFDSVFAFYKTVPDRAVPTRSSAGSPLIGTNSA